jgi:regulatory protein
MGSEVPGADSSSPNARRTLIEIGFLRTGTAGELRLKLVLSDGSCFFVTEQVLSDLGLGAVSPPVVLDEATLLELGRQAGILAAREKALDLLGRSPASERSLRLKLRDRAFPPEAIDEAVAWLAARGLLDDRRFAEAWLAVRLERHPEGREALIAGLRHRGVDRSTAAEVVLRVVDSAVEREAAQRLLSKLRRRGACSQEELARRLAARGFRRCLVRSLLESGE